MKKHLLCAVLLAVALLFVATGCDWIRASLGKPTSADLALLREAKAAREQAVRDSIAAAEAERIRLEAEAAAAAAAEAAVVRRYYAVAGAFKEDIGAQLYEDKLRENGFKVRTFDFKSGLKVVCVDGNDTLAVVLRDMAALKKLGIAPTDPWVYNTNQKLHKPL
ncbi:MAG: hypothetical protein IKX34_07225 [Bacteroidales bacterium]|nr:hypothetical protein [Bacteroidales bacterium]